MRFLTMQRLIGSRRQYQNLVPFVGQQFGVNLNGNLQVKRQLLCPRDQLVYNRITDVAQFVADLGLVLEKLGEMRQGGDIFHCVKVD